MTVARNVEGDVDPLRAGDPGIDFILQPVVRDFPLNDLDIPAKLRAKVAAVSGDAKPTFCAARGKTTVGSADRAAFAESNLVGVFLGGRLRLCLGRNGWLLRLDFGVLALNLDGVGLFLFDFGFRL